MHEFTDVQIGYLFIAILLCSAALIGFIVGLKIGEGRRFQRAVENDKTEGE